MHSTCAPIFVTPAIWPGTVIASDTNMKILVIDDEPPMRELFVDLLDMRGHHVVAQGDFPVVWPAEGYDRIILDLTLPSGSGWQWAATAKQLLGQANRLIITTASGDPAAAEIARKEGYTFLKKPFRPEDLDDAVRLGGAW